jgi:hypothetical protein
MHRRADLYGMDAEIFRPERWNEDMPLFHDPTNAKWGYLPFNGGPRVCLGSKHLLPLTVAHNLTNHSGFCADRSRIYGCTDYPSVPKTCSA